MEEISIQEALQAYGFSQKETQVYLTCLELGTTTANEIANRADINRSTTYDLLKALIEKGIASKVSRNNKTQFEVVGPEHLLSSLEERKQKLKIVYKQLKALQEKTVEKPDVRVFEGHAGIKTILDDILQTGGNIEVISHSKIFNAFGWYFPQFIKQKREHKVFSRVIQEVSKQTEELRRQDKKEERETRGLEGLTISSATFIYGETVAIIKLERDELIGIVIEDKVLSHDKREMFELLWKQAR